MARLWTCGFELNSATAGVELELVTGTPTISTTQVQSGTYAAKIDSAAASHFFQHRILSSPTTVNWYTRIYFYPVANPTGGDFGIIAFDGYGINLRVQLVMSTDGKVRVDKFGTGYIGVASAVVTTGAWHLLEVHIDNTGSAGSHIVQAKLDGTLFTDINTETIGSINSFDIGNYKGNTGTMYLDDFAVNDGSGSFQNTWIGSGKTIYLHPNAAGDNSAWTNSYTAVNEVTPNDATNFSSSNTLDQIADHNLDASSLASTDGVNVVHVGARYRGAGASANSSYVLRVKASSGGTVEESAAITPANTTWITNSTTPLLYNLTLYDKPGADVIKWSNTDLDNAQIGYRLSTANTNNVDITTVWMVVDYTPNTGTTTSSSTSSSTSTTTSTSSSTTTTSTSTSTTTTSTSTSITTSTSTTTTSTSSSSSTTTTHSTSTSITTTSTSTSTTTTSTSTTSSTSSSTTTTVSLTTSTTTTSTTTTSTSTTSTSTSTTSTTTSTTYPYHFGIDYDSLTNLKIGTNLV